MEQVHATIAEYLPQILARTKALVIYRNRMLELLAVAASQDAVSQPSVVRGEPRAVQP